MENESKGAAIMILTSFVGFIQIVVIIAKLFHWITAGWWIVLLPVIVMTLLLASVAIREALR